MGRRLGRRQFLRLSATAALGVGAAACASTPEAIQMAVKETAVVETGAGEGTMKFTTFTNAGLGISSVVPAGWVEKSAGEFHRGDQVHLQVNRSENPRAVSHTSLFI